MPLQKATNSDSLMTQYEMHAIEALGLLKFDFLGLSNLTILRQAVDFVRDNRGIAIDLDAIPLDDAKTFELLASGETTGIFQLESPGMRRYIRELQPTSVYDLAAMVALYRPGPMDNIPAYIRRKHGREPVTYLHPLLEPYLDKTYGIFVYQEDIMSAAVALGGFTGPEADTLGYAIRKKKSTVLRAQKEKFVSQAAERGVEPQIIDAVFKAFEPFERYGFNKAHATCYGLIAYQTAYLKANHTVDYMTAVLTAFRANEEKVAAAVAECRRMSIEVLPPDVHQSHLEFTVEGDAIRFGLLAVKNVGQGAIESIIAARAEGGPFRSLTDFCTRIDLRLANRKVLEALIKVGALRAFGHPAQVLLGLDDAIGSAQATQRDRITGQTSLFDLGRRRGGPVRAAPARRDRGPGPRAPALGEGAARAVPVGAPDGRGGRAGRPLRQRLLGRPQGRGARRPAGRHRRHRDRHPDRSSPSARRRWPSPRSRTSRARSRSSSSRGCTRPSRPTWRDGVDPARGRSRRPQGRGGLAAGRPRRGLGRGGGPRARGVRPGRGGRRSVRWQERGSAAAAGAGRAGQRQRRAGIRPGRRDRLAPPRGVNGQANGTPPDAMPRIQPRRAGRGLHGTRRRRGGRRRRRTTSTRSRPSPTRPGPGSSRTPPPTPRSTPVPRPSSTSGSSEPRRRTSWSGPWRRSRPCCATVPARPRSSSTCPVPGGAALPMELRWGVAYDAELLAEVRRRLGDELVDLRLAAP